MKKFIFLITAVMFIFLLVSCVPNVNGETDDGDTFTGILVKSFIEYTQTNIEFVAYKDGKTGDWVKLTGTSGTYQFTPSDGDGNYSIFAVYKAIDPWSDDTLYDIRIMNMNKSEGSLVPLYFDDMTYTYDATVNLNFSGDFIDKSGAVFFGHQHGFPWFNDISDLNYPLEYYESTNDLTLLVAPDQSSDFNKIYIERDYDLTGEKSKSINYSDFVAFETFVATSTLEDVGTWGDLLVGGNTFLFTWLNDDRYVRIPDSISSPDDLYEIGVGKNESGFYISNLKFISNPSDIESMDVLPSSNWSTPTISNNVISWDSYNSGITDQSIRVYTANLMNGDWTISWEITNSIGWLGTSSSYNYEIPNLSSLDGWNSLWIPDGVNDFSDFSAISTNENDLIQILNPENGLEMSTISY